VPASCPSCGSDELIEIGFGTEKIEDVVKDIFPLAKVARLDYDTTRSKKAYEKIIADFSLNKVDVLVGTQMITKGLDFENIAVVGVLNADLLLFFPDFRASERAFQLLTQVAGRAGRRKDQGKVVIQTSKPTHPVIIDVVNNHYHKLILREAYERKQFLYPPYFRMINILLKHKDVKKVHEAAEIMAMQLKTHFGKRVIGPAEPGVARLRGQFLRTITIKLEKNNAFIGKAKKTIQAVKSYVLDHKGLKAVRINIDVDPY
jgi:primosomal protein N' (replication factor Y)